jgi:hypothetical protein
LLFAAVVLLLDIPAATLLSIYPLSSLTSSRLLVMVHYTQALQVRLIVEQLIVASVGHDMIHHPCLY